MKIPALKPDAITTAKSLPSLALLVIRPSSSLKMLTSLFYVAFLIATLILFWPYRWAWLVMPLLSFVVIVCWRGHLRRIGIVHRLWFEQGKWLLESGGIRRRVYLSGETLVWPRIIILGFKLESTSKVLRLVVMQDSVSQSDFRRLARWLRVCLKPGH